MDFWSEQVTGMLMASVQKPQTTAQAGDKTQDGSFQKLLDKQQTAQSGKPESKTEDTQEPTAQAEAQPVDAEGQPLQPVDPKELEKQMSLAAMAMMQNPVVAAIAEDTPQVLTDPSWEEGLVPVGFDDSEDGSLRIVHWLRPYQGTQNLEEANAEAGEWIEEEDAQAAEAGTAAPAVTAAGEKEEEVLVTAVAQGTEAAEPEGDEAEMPEETVQAPETPVFEDVQEIPVKVGEAPRAEETPEVPVEKQIGGKIAQAVEAGETRVELQLEPENLGRVTVEMTVSENGTLHVALHAENSRTVNLLERGLDNLHMMLARNAQQDVQVEVQRQEESQRQDLYDGRQGHPQQQEQQHRHHQGRREGEDFLQQLRLGLVPADGE